MDETYVDEITYNGEDVLVIIEGSNAKFTWGVKNGKELQKLLTSFTYKKKVSLVEGMKKMMPVYHVLGLIPAVRNISNKIIVMEKN